MNQPTAPRPELYRTDYKNMALMFGAAFLGTLLALGLLMLFGRILVKRQLNDLAKIGPPEPQPIHYPQREPEPVEFSEVQTDGQGKEPEPLTEEQRKEMLRQKALNQPRVGNKFVKKPTE